MTDPVRAILDGMSVVGMHRQLLAVVLLVLFTSQLLLYSLLRSIFGDRLSGEEYTSLSLGGWLLPASLISLLWYAGTRIGSPQFGFLAGVILPLLAAIALSTQNPKDRLDTSRAAVIALFLLAGLFLLLRLAYISKAVVPLYFDSAQHYRFINEILIMLEKPGAGIQFPAGYYHLGFHVLTAFITSITHAETTDVMLVLGQVILAWIPFSVFFLVRHGTRSNGAGFFAVALAAFGWYMPAHAVDWGKYPALASLALLPFVIGLAYLSIQYRNLLPNKYYRSLLVLLTAGVLISVILHSRSLVVYSLLALSWLMTTAWNRPSKRLQFLVLGLLILILLVGILLIRSEGILAPLFDTYGMSTLISSASILVLSVFAWRAYPGLVFFCLLSISLFLASLFLPLTDLVPGYANTTLLDRPFVQMILYLPLTLLGGFGLAGLEQTLAGRKVTWRTTRLAPGKIIAGVLTAVVVINGLLRYDFYPSSCCEIVSNDDLAAIRWLDENLPADALILTSSTDLNTLPTDEFQGRAGGDAGTWITPLTGRPVASIPFNTDFSRRQTLDSLCLLKVGYIYIGMTGWYFDDSGMSVQPDGFKLLLTLPKAKVYEITGCK